eukprot:TRINITY_DN12156_c0_g1_i1.p1 TRINITY_DN12156_c0_g1~~TRINITY_DN12156_c0_g1_i1.p1  ORF type:complete len:281 (+),score=79.21 TRINITY_DN12156_c0_g1_i1:96-845(+)
MPADAGGVAVRAYRAGDTEAVHAVFSDGMRSLAPGVLRSVMRLLAPHLAVIAVSMGAALYYAGRDPASCAAIPAAAVVLAYCVLRQFVRGELNKYIKDSINSDLRDIEAHYLSSPHTHFWVAVRPGDDGKERVMGCVALDAADRPAVSKDEAKAKANAPKHEGTWGELRRMSVCSKARRQNIASKLYSALEAHARDAGLRGITLTTSSAQWQAMALYRKLGFVEKKRVPIPIPLIGSATTVHFFDKQLA